jgi:hypothetical protein
MTIFITSSAGAGLIWQVEDHEKPAEDGTVKFHMTHSKWLFTAAPGDWFPTFVEAGIDAKKRVAAKVARMEVRLQKLKTRRFKLKVV